MLFSLYSGAFLYPALRLEVSLILKPWLLLYLASCYPIFSISKKYGVNNRSSLLYFITLIFAVLLLTMGFAQAGRREQISAIYRYSNSVGGDPVSESTFCYKLYSVFLMGSSTGRDVIYDPHLRKARTLTAMLLRRNFEVQNKYQLLSILTTTEPF